MRYSLNLKRTTPIAILLPVLALGLLTFSAIPVAHAYGKAQWQVTLSENCNNASLCGGSTGGDWGWCALGGSGSWADCQITGYGKVPGSGAGPGLIHVSLDVTLWTIDTSGVFAFWAGTATFSGGSMQGPPVTVPLSATPFFGLSPVPASPGHYSFESIFGFDAPPGIHLNIQANQIP